MIGYKPYNKIIRLFLKYIYIKTGYTFIYSIDVYKENTLILIDTCEKLYKGKSIYRLSRNII